MILKMISKEQQDGQQKWVNTAYFYGVSNVNVTHSHGKVLGYSISFVCNGEEILRDMLEYDQVFVMNDEGKTIDTLRNVDRQII